MTKKEAIKVLQREKYYVQQAIQKATDGDGYVSPDGLIRADDYVEACTEAISALRQQDVPYKDVGKMTNADRIRAMSDEELAKLMLDGCRGSKCDDQPQNEFGSVNCFQCRMKWLQQQAEEDDHA